jgi:hypothetical protein
MFLPRLPANLTPSIAMEAAMKIGYALLAKFGLFAPKTQAPDVFDLRLQRIGTRERRCQTKPILFRPQPQLMAA